MNFERIPYDDEHFATDTSIEQENVEKIVGNLFRVHANKAEIDADAPQLNIDQHISYLRQFLFNLPSCYTCLDCSRPWMCYWICHSLILLGHELNEDEKSHIIRFLENCQNEGGGFGGGPGQLSHLASTYAAVNALCCIGTEEAYNIINRKELSKFLWSVKCPSGAFRLEINGEIDIRGAYCALSIASITNIYSNSLFQHTAEWLVSCQTYEGGFSGYPGMEAHGGYTFCGIAALSFLHSTSLCDIKSLLRWTVSKQMPFEGGFQGRTNKLVDGCYSFWQGAIFPIISAIQDFSIRQSDDWVFNRRALQEYILICCQHPNGGLIDKPDKPRDTYHTCYTLSGLSIAQHPPNIAPDTIGCKNNLLAPIHPLYNLEVSRVKKASTYFQLFQNCS